MAVHTPDVHAVWRRILYAWKRHFCAACVKESQFCLSESISKVSQSVTYRRQLNRLCMYVLAVQTHTANQAQSRPESANQLACCYHQQFYKDTHCTAPAITLVLCGTVSVSLSVSKTHCTRSECVTRTNTYPSLNCVLPFHTQFLEPNAREKRPALGTHIRHRHVTAKNSIIITVDTHFQPNSNRRCWAS